MKQVASRISTYSADVFGVCSALYELGGMVVMHDPSGCNSTYTTHDEPRWSSMESMIFISGLTEMEAIMGDDEKLIADVVREADAMHPAFIVVAGGPISNMIGLDFEAVSLRIEEETGIPSIGISTNGMNSYVDGASRAFLKIAERFVNKDPKKTADPSVNILGLTPLDFSLNGEAEDIRRFAQKLGFSVLSTWAMGTTLEDIQKSSDAWVNLVVSADGLAVAEWMQRQWEIPYVVGVPFGHYEKERIEKELLDAVWKTADSSHAVNIKSILRNPILERIELKEEERERFSGRRTVIIGEGVRSVSLAREWEARYGTPVGVICATEAMGDYLRPGDAQATDEDEILPLVADAEVVIADPLYRPILPSGCDFVSLPHVGFSGRTFADRIPNLVKNSQWKWN